MSNLNHPSCIRIITYYSACVTRKLVHRRFTR